MLFENITKNIELKIFNPRLHEVGLPTRGTDGAAAYDLRSCEDNPITLKPGTRHKFRLGFGVHIGDKSIAALVMPRSGLGSKGLRLANTVGLIDSDYQGEIVATATWDPEDNETEFTINPGDRIFQMIFIPVVPTTLDLVEEFSTETDRGESGFGSTGV